ncbi:unnamed protein product [Toxocara canis]|uniref:Uncharacterized protein n=1 Tax=Toxocara canis TaxID=6265 RepID=A0A183UH14_TOXCA|nr:unnamed protein product [Toxocara canis]
MRISMIYVFIILYSTVLITEGGPITYVACVAACNAAVVACYASLGFVFGTVTAGAGTPAAVLACNAAQSACWVGCSAGGVAPTP